MSLKLQSQPQCPQLLGQRLMGETKWEKGIEIASCDFLRFPAVSCSFAQIAALQSVTLRPQKISGEAFLLTVGAFLLTVKLLCLQSLKALIRRTFPL